MDVLIYIRDRIDEEIKKANFKKLEFIKSKVGLSQDGYYRMFSKGSLKLNTFLDICTALNVNPVDLFPRDEKMQSPDKYTKILEENNLMLKEKLEKYEKNIKD